MNKIPASSGNPEAYPPVPIISFGLYFIIKKIDDKYASINLKGNNKFIKILLIDICLWIPLIFESLIVLKNQI